MYESELKKVRQNIQELAIQFGLKYKKELYKVTFLTSEELTILQFLTSCPEPFYIKFGKTDEERIKRIDEFLSSKDYANLTKKRFGGSGVDVKRFRDNIKKLKNVGVKEKCKNILKKLKPTISNISIVVSLPQTERQRKFVFRTILFHEWIHILLISNGIYFQDIKREYWKLDEGLTTYLQTLFKKKRVDISEIIKGEIKRSKKPSLFPLYAKNALKFNAILKNKENPTERRKAILNYYKKLKGKLSQQLN